MHKLSLVLIVLAGVSVSCQDKDVVESSVIGKWKLIEELFDPGDGSGTFQPVTRNMTIEFFNNNTFASSENLCASSTGNSTTGTFSLDDKTLSPENCSNSGFILHFNLEGSNLIISYPCIEPCQQKFVKVQVD